uniref:Fruit protein pKIWI502-like n=1 Tax=Elaeis guineensis var. tenera TaxID=51953 RepID=A0A6J0PKP4_ELAGV|nr:fruit protein pKIWI502-like [Elaeis guineensis]
MAGFSRREILRFAIESESTYLLPLTFHGGPIRLLIELGFNANKRSDVRLYYGARKLQRIAYQVRFKDWECTGVKIVSAFSQPDDRWKGEQGYVHAAFSRAKQILNPSLTGAVLYDVTSVLVADGVPKDKILKNF